MGGNNSPLNFLTNNHDIASTVIANGLSTQNIFGVDFGNLIFRNGGPKILVSPIIIKGNLTIESGATFNGSAETLTLNGNWINSGTFAPSTGTVLWSGTSKTITGNTTFNKVFVTGSYNHSEMLRSMGCLRLPNRSLTVDHDSYYSECRPYNSGVLYTLEPQLLQEGSSDLKGD